MSSKDKATSLANKMNKITEKFSQSIDMADELEVTGDDIVEFIEEKTQNIELFSESIPAEEIINLKNLVDDFQYVRETLKENTDNGRRVLNAVTYDLLDSDDDKRAQLIMSFAELNKAVADNMKLYVMSYKEISNTLLNIDKIRKAQGPDAPGNVTNNLHVHTEAINTVDLIKSLSAKNK